MNRNLKYIYEHLNIKKDGIIIISFNQNQKKLEFTFSSKQNIKFLIELDYNFGVKRIKLLTKDIEQSFLNLLIRNSLTYYNYIKTFFKMFVGLKKVK